MATLLTTCGSSCTAMRRRTAFHVDEALRDATTPSLLRRADEVIR